MIILLSSLFDLGGSNSNGLYSHNETMEAMEFLFWKHFSMVQILCGISYSLLFHP